MMIILHWMIESVFRYRVRVDRHTLINLATYRFHNKPHCCPQCKRGFITFQTLHSQSASRKRHWSYVSTRWSETKSLASCIVLVLTHKHYNVDGRVYRSFANIQRLNISVHPDSQFRNDSSEQITLQRKTDRICVDVWCCVTFVIMSMYS